ncbi:MAG: ROK family protein [Proteobacteria bacterium]|uniref:ROK family protein n=1 Tax=Candidatus Avisuccinivibrio stercorigallinarum TaxID=2840704 RepID=A0A9D9DBL7_9GAMM|nr:ROK family protein [Candidatus Avisuccinivibrio stercorigallinarum]
MSHTEHCILIDIGGTAIKYGLTDFEGSFVEKHEIPTEAQEHGGPGIVRKVLQICKELQQTHGPLRCCAISTAGMVDPHSGQIVYALPDAIPDYTGVNFKALLLKECGLVCEVENDVNCAALGELWQGAGRGLHSVFCLTVGTSIGGAMICEGRLVSGASHSAGEIAYMRIPGGTLHQQATTTALVRNFAQKSGRDLHAVNGKVIFDLAEKGDALAVQAINELIEPLTDGIANIISVQNPQMVILGGGIMARSAYLRPLIEASLSRKIRPIVAQATQIAFALLKNDAGMLGALYNLRQRQGFTKNIYKA